MTWGGDGFVDLPDSTTWSDSAAHSATWTSHGADIDLWTGGPNFHLYYSFWNGSVWSTSAEITGVLGKLEQFTIKHGVKSWWQGIRAGSASIVVDYTDQISVNLYGRGQRIRITVDVPSGEVDLFTGHVHNVTTTYDVAGYPKLNVQLLDIIGWIGQANVPSAFSLGTQQTGYILDALIGTYGGVSISAGVLGGVTTTDGLYQTALGGGSLVDNINKYMRGDLGLLYVDNSGAFQFIERNWWNPLGDPDVTIGSLDRGNTTSTWLDPSLAEGTYVFPQRTARYWGPVSYTEWTHTFPGPASSTVSTAAGAFGVRAWTDAVQNFYALDVTDNLDALSAVLYNDPLYRGHFDSNAQIQFQAEYSVDSMNYAAAAAPSDFVELSREAVVNLGYRHWTPGHVMGVSHSWNPTAGWICTLDLDLGLAEADHDTGEPEEPE